MKVLIGSQAMNFWKEDLGLDFRAKEPKDTDYFTDEPTEGPKIDTFFHPNLYLWEWSGPIASLDELYTIKISHSYWIINGTDDWQKHMYHAYHLKKSGAKLLPKLHKILYEIWENKYGPKKANLEVPPEEFFNSNVTRIYEHDSIHASVAYYDEPLFNKILRDGSQVAVDQKKFNKLPELQKQRLVFEELAATTLERDIIPSYYTNIKRIERDWSRNLMKLITSYSKGWFATYVSDNFPTFRKPDVDFLEMHYYNSERLVFHPDYLQTKDENDLHH